MAKLLYNIVNVSVYYNDTLREEVLTLLLY